MKKLLCLLLFVCTAPYFQGLSAQEKKWVSGTLKDRNGNPVIAATITEKGTSNQVVSDATGAFRLQVAPSATLVISSVGYAGFETGVGESSTLNLIMELGSQGLDEVVVTALGIKRQKKSLGYAVQEVKSQTLIEAREPNVTNALAGVVAGMQIVRSNNGPAGSSRINLRGLNSFSPRTQPLIVVDGIPVDNFVGETNNVTGKPNSDAFNPSLDMGNGLSDINANDIESISVLKGPSAAALYGSRAGNGAILITTRSGGKTPGLGISVSSTLGIETMFLKPDRQSSFAQGSLGAYEPTGGLSWGPKITGQTVTNWKGEQEQLAAYDNLSNFFDKNGINHAQNISFQQQINKTSVYTSLGYFNDKSLIPGVKLSRLNLTARAVSKFGKDDRWTTDTKIQYINSDARNRPIAGINYSNYATQMMTMPVSMDVRQFEPAVNDANNMLWYVTSNQINPYWATRYNTNQDIRDRFIMSGSLKYNFTSWLDAEVKVGTDKYNTNYESKLYAGSPLGQNGRYSTGKQTFTETNYSTLITAKKDNVFGKLGGVITVGGNIMDRQGSNLKVDAGELFIPNLFKATNGKDNPTISDEVVKQKINSVYGSVGLNWGGYLFLDVTARNDWSSTLSVDNRSFFYPSFSLSYLLTESISGLPGWLSYAKLRATYAAVGNSLQPYELYNTYNIDKDPNNNPIAGRKETLYDPDVRSELIKSIELGTELRFMDNRIGLDFSYYKTNATYQLIDLPMDPASGYNFRKINAGDIQNQGFELMADARILTNPAGLNWSINVNFSSNRNKIINISDADSVTSYPVRVFDDLSIVSYKNELYGDMYGTRFLRVEDPASKDFGKLILSAAGLPQEDTRIVRLGNQSPTAMLGITNTFGYKGWNLGFLVDARFGGKIFSATRAALQRSGVAAETVVNGERADLVVDGVVADGSGGYAANTVAVDPQRYWEAITNAGNLGIVEANLYDATNIRLRNVQLSYDLPRKLLQKTPLQRARVGISCNNVWMIKHDLGGIDPESVFATGINAQGFENGNPPTTRSFLINLSLSF
ncbi:MAG: SusC/RagA family TonB-linked outer membrane protein [Candidatus Pseudobacter hemicellulosilyticus]|uniref:SusC/RagA family TonB-linked outer membrane protein n=1 Tax=Candidatus Pseudobacter hemicellulosilyticus TaxID=3121375 RepID=A0AAJ5WRU8_9BACT|nr:MAG: SusC/RagA family TonB-linked outer membrane protein [Pseudobacter sp.]